ncbi:RipA family octameric membrane protein [Streptomyces sp. NPDC055239]
MTPPPGPNQSPEVLELYKLAVEMADRISARRGAANAFFLSVQSALVTLVGFGTPKLAESPWWVSLAVALAGTTLSATWWMQLRSYRDLNTAKFQVINKLEEHLPVRVFADEWDALKRDPIAGWRKRYAELGTSERVVPLVFTVAHLILFVGTLAA